MAEEERKSHVWWFRMERTSKPKQHEFGMPITKRDASDRIAKQHGLKELPSSAVVSHLQLEKLEPEPETRTVEVSEESPSQPAKKT